MATAPRGWKAGRKWIREPGDLPAPAGSGGTRGRWQQNPGVTLVLGGARSGKSEWAERLAAALPPPVTYVATAATAGDRRPGVRGPHRGPPAPPARRLDDGRGRRRPDRRARRARGQRSWSTPSGPGWPATPDFAVDTPRAVRDAARSQGARLHGRGVGGGRASECIPSPTAGGRFRDVMGSLNRAVADVADEVLLVVAGRALPPGRSRPRPPGRGRLTCGPRSPS